MNVDLFQEKGKSTGEGYFVVEYPDVASELIKLESQLVIKKGLSFTAYWTEREAGEKCNFSTFFFLFSAVPACAPHKSHRGTATRKVAFFANTMCQVHF